MGFNALISSFAAQQKALQAFLKHGRLLHIGLALPIVAFFQSSRPLARAKPLETLNHLIPFLSGKPSLLSATTRPKAVIHIHSQTKLWFWLCFSELSSYQK